MYIWRWGIKYPPFPYIFSDGYAKEQKHATFGSNFLSRRLDRVDDISFGGGNARNEHTKAGTSPSKFQGPHASFTTNSCGRIYLNKLS